MSSQAPTSQMSMPLNKSADPDRIYINVLVYTMLGVYSTMIVVHLLHVLIYWTRQGPSASERRVVAKQSEFTKVGKLSTWLKRYLTRPALAGETHIATKAIGFLPPVSFPTRIESLLIFSYILLNIVLGSAGYDLANPGLLKMVANRHGSLALVNIAFLSLHAGRNSPIVLLADLDFSTSILFLRYIGRLTIAQSCVHSGIELHFFLKQGPSILKHFWEVKPIVWGFFAFLASLIILVQSTGPLRRAFYECFRMFHILLAIVFLLGTWYHSRLFANHVEVKFLIGAYLLYAGDLSLRVVKLVASNVPLGKIYGNKKRFSQARIEAVAGATRMTISLPRLWHVKPGQHVFLHIPTLGPFQAHPFTVAWVDKHGDAQDFRAGGLDISDEKDDRNDNHTLELVIKANDGLTRTLFKRAQKNPNSRLVVMVEGPYGQTRNLDRYDEVALFCAGVGITYALLVVRHHLEQQNARKIRQTMSLTWICQYERQVAWVQHILDEIVENSAGSFRMTIYISRAKKESFHMLQQDYAARARTQVIETVPVKPNIKHLVASSISDRAGTLAVVSCGPGHFSDEIRQVMVEYAQERVDYFEEAFSW